MDKPTDGHEGEEAPVTSPPPLELRRPASGGTPYGTVVRNASTTGLRTTAVPLGLQSPHAHLSSLDRATDSPQVASVYMHGPRMSMHGHYGAAPVAGTRFYEAPGEPPPAHRAHSVGPPLPGVAHASAAAHANPTSYLHQQCPPTLGLPPGVVLASRHCNDSESIPRAIHLTISPQQPGQVGDTLFTRLKVT